MSGVKKYVEIEDGESYFIKNVKTYYVRMGELMIEPGAFSWKGVELK